jgi:hypothetical protein
MSPIKRRVEFRVLRRAKTKKCGKSHLKTLTKDLRPRRSNERRQGQRTSQKTKH